MLDTVLNPELIAEAAKSPLGVFSLVAMLLALIALVFFRRSPNATKALVFIIMIVGVLGFFYTTSGLIAADANLNEVLEEKRKIEEEKNNLLERYDKLERDYQSALGHIKKAGAVCRSKYFDCEKGRTAKSQVSAWVPMTTYETLICTNLCED